MLYPKNVPNVERVARIMMGIVLIGLVLAGPSVFGVASPLRDGLLLLAAAGVIVTGFVGWCPACALLGRKLKSSQRATAHEH